jgi:rare lipoprotein A
MLAAGVMAFGAGSFSGAANAGTQCGMASWYDHTSRTASGERGNPNGFTAAHRSLPFGTKVKVVNLANSRSVTVRVNDRGPFVRGRVIDVTRAAADQLGFRRRGVARVKVVAAGSGGSC